MGTQDREQPGPIDARIARRVLFASALAALAVSGCGAETAGTPIQYEMAVSSTVSRPTESASSFTLDSGWSVELERAEVVLGPIFIQGGGRRASILPSLLELLGPAKAYAHPSDSTFDGGPPLGEFLDQQVVDLLEKGSTSLGLSDGLAGLAQTFELQFHPPGYATSQPDSPQMMTMGGHSFVLEGVARKDGEERPFLAAGDLGRLASERAVTSIDTDVTLVDVTERAGPLLLSVQLDAWFRFVDFATLSEQDDQGRYLLPQGTVGGDSLRRGIRSRTAYGLSWSPQP